MAQAATVVPAQQQRAYSLLTIKEINQDRRIVRGIATTPTPDRYGDIVEPLGVKFTNPMPFLWQHDARKPIGTASFGKPTKDGIPFEAELPVITEPGALKDRIDEAWQSITLGLVTAVSIGFRPIEYAYLEGGGIRWMECEVYELSAVTIPAQPDAVITGLKKMDQAAIAVIKRFDVGAPAATGRMVPGGDVTPGATGKTTKQISTQPKERPMAKTTAEQITAFETKRAANVARMDGIMQKSVDEGRSLDESEQEEFDNLDVEVGTIDKSLERLRKMEQLKATSAKQVIKVNSTDDGSAARGPSVVVVAQPKAAAGVLFARLAKVKAVSQLTFKDEISVAERMYGPDSDVVGVMKANEVAPGLNTTGNWAAKLTGAETSAFADFAAFLRPATILGKFGTGNIPGLRSVPFREPLISQTGGGAAYWVGEGKPTPLTAFGFDRSTLEPLKIGNIAVLSKENILSSNPSSDIIVRDSLRDAIVAGQDVAFIDPTNAGSAGAKPKSITNGQPVIVSHATTDADAIRKEVRAVFQKFIDASNVPSTGVWVMSSTNALALSLMVNALGNKEFPGMTMQGGIFEGLPAIVSDYVGSIVALVNATDVYEADNGEVTVDMSTEASLEMKSVPTQDGTSSTGASLVSLWQSGLVGLKAEKTINWKLRRASAVAYLSGVHWGGAVPAS